MRAIEHLFCEMSLRRTLAMNSYAASPLARCAGVRSMNLKDRSGSESGNAAASCLKCPRSKRVL